MPNFNEVLKIVSKNKNISIYEANLNSLLVFLEYVFNIP